MLQVHIDDLQLEERIQTQARQAGQTAQEFIQEILSATVSSMEFPRLNPLQHGRIIENEVPESEELDAVQPFAEVMNPADFAQQLRKQAWR